MGGFRLRDAAIAAVLAAFVAVATIVSAFAGKAIFDSGYGKAFGFAVVAAGITALTSFLHNVAGFLPDDPTQTKPPPRS